MKKQITKETDPDTQPIAPRPPTQELPTELTGQKSKLGRR
jgi:hypothetical protein